jgi:PleD family two-component response regulator
VIQIQDLSISYTVSTGIYYGLSTSLDEMIKLSDEALYDSKENGRNMITIKS